MFPSRQHCAFHIIGGSGAAQHCRGLDDIPHHERCSIRKADVPLIFVTANGEVPCDEVIATDIPQLGITRDMYVMKDSLNVISIDRLVLDDGCDVVWKHRDRQAILVSPKGKRTIYGVTISFQCEQHKRRHNNQALIENCLHRLPLKRSARTMLIILLLRPRPKHFDQHSIVV